MYNQTSSAIESDGNLPAAYFPAHPDNLPDDLDYDAITHWCTGFEYAVQLDEDWNDSEELMRIIFPILIILADENSPTFQVVLNLGPQISPVIKP